ERSGRLMHRLSTRFEIRRNALIRKKGQMCLRVRIALAERGCKICVEGRERCKLSFKRSLFLGDLRYSGRNACEANFELGLLIRLCLKQAKPAARICHCREFSF